MLNNERQHNMFLSEQKKNDIQINLQNVGVHQATINSIIQYFDWGCPTGSFTKAILTNDLFGTYSKADSNNSKLIGDIVRVIYMYCPISAYGSPAAYDEWIKYCANERNKAS